MKRTPILGRPILGSALAVLLAFSVACQESSPAPDAPAAVAPDPATTAVQAVPADAWWDHLEALCGNAFAGVLTSEDEADADFAGRPMTMHVRRCEPSASSASGSRPG